MKKVLRLIALGLVLALLSGTVVLAGTPAPEGAQKVDAVNTDAIVSEYTDVTAGTGGTVGFLSGHGHGATRMVTVSSGTYYAFFTDEDYTNDPMHWSLFRVNNDGTTEVVYSDQHPYYASGPVIFVMADKNEDIWVYAGWSLWSDSPGARYVASVYHYDVDRDIVTTYSGYVPLAGGGYSGACIDPERGEIYAVVNFGDGEGGAIGWTVFDMKTKEWSTPQLVWINYRHCYSYLLPDGNGGFHCFGQRDVRAAVIMTDVGLNVLDAAKKYHSHWQNASYVFDEWVYFHIPDPTKPEITVQEPVEKVVYEVLKGMFPDSHMADAFMDAEGYLHFVCSMQENITPGFHTVHVVYDVSDGGFKEVKRENIDFLSGPNRLYNARMYQDTTGAFYVVGAAAGADHMLEIWMAETPLDPLTLVYAEELPPDFNLMSDGLHTANSRSNSVMSDTMTLGMDGYSEELQWYRWLHFEIDLAALREYRDAIGH